MAQLLDAYGRPIPVQRRPILDVVAAVSVRDRWSTYPSAGLTPGALARILREADAGDVTRQAELFEEMEEKDAHLYSLLQTRKNGVLGLDWEVIPFSDRRSDRRVAEFVSDVLGNLEGFEESLLDLLDAIGKGFSVLEILWSVEGREVRPARLVWVHPKHFRVGPHGELRLLTDDSPAAGVELVPHKFVVHRYKARSGYMNRAGILRVVSWLYLFKNASLKDWVRYAEVFGMPLRVGRYDPSASEEDKQALFQAVRDLGADAAGIISKATEIEFVETKVNTGGSPYRELAEYIDRQMSKAVLGQTLTSDVGERGSYAASKTHDAVRQDLKEADCKALAETLRVDLIRPLVMFNFGPDALDRLPWIKWHYEPAEDLKATAEIYGLLVERVGLPIAAEHIYERFGIPAPEPGQTVLAPRPTPTLPLRDRPVGMMRHRAQDAPSPAPAQAQAMLDDLATQAARRGADALGETLAPLLDIIRDAQDLEQLRDRLIAAYPELDTRAFEDLLARAIYVAELVGRWSAGG